MYLSSTGKFWIYTREYTITPVAERSEWDRSTYIPGYVRHDRHITTKNMRVALCDCCFWKVSGYVLGRIIGYTTVFTSADIEAQVQPAAVGG